jgi:hypothetical protein
MAGSVPQKTSRGHAIVATPIKDRISQALIPGRWKLFPCFIHASIYGMSTSLIEGLTATGRATVRLLQMNAKRRIDIRRELIEEGMFH